MAIRCHSLQVAAQVLVPAGPTKVNRYAVKASSVRRLGKDLSVLLVLVLVLVRLLVAVQVVLVRVRVRVQEVASCFHRLDGGGEQVMILVLPKALQVLVRLATLAILATLVGLAAALFITVLVAPVLVQEEIVPPLHLPTGLVMVMSHDNAIAIASPSKLQ
jgi:ABC-type phosphate/phosphonate transport system permease subunit